MSPFRSLIVLLAFSPLVVLGNAFSFSLADTVQQCEPLFVEFSNTENIDTNHTPTSFTVFPLNSSTFSLPIPANSMESTGLSVSFLPLASGSQFIASLDDDAGNNVAKVSEVIRVLDSNNTSCLSPSSPATLRLPNSLAQCGEFTVSYGGPSAPVVRLLRPGKDSRLATQVSDDTEAKTARYVMSEDYGSEVVLYAFDEKLKTGRTSNLLTVEGDASSPTSCFKQDADEEDNDMIAVSGGLSKGGIVGLSVAGGIILLAGVIMGVYILIVRRRQKRRERNRVVFQPTFIQDNRSRESIVDRESKRERATPSPLTIPSHIDYSSDVVHSPVYANQVYSPTISSFVMISNRGSVNGSAISRGSMQPPPLRHHESIASALSHPRQSQNDSLNPNDIESMLIAASHIDRQSDLARTVALYEHRKGLSESHSPMNAASPMHLSQLSITSSTEMYQDLFTRPSPSQTPIPTLEVLTQSHFSTPSSPAGSNTFGSQRDSDSAYMRNGQGR